jgi:Tfp pilus assembly protein PilX
MTVGIDKRKSERGIALIVVLLLMAVLSGLATGFALTGQTEVSMSTNEVYFAGARAAAEAGLNRALVKIFADTSTNWIAGADGLVDVTNASAAVNVDNGSLASKLGAGPYYVDSANRYSYELQILDDDNDLLYETPLTSAQRAAMGESGNSPYVNQNDRVILRAIGYGPNGTVVRLARIIETVDTVTTSTTTTTVLSNPAILVNGDFEMNGNITVQGTSGSVHANGNLAKTGSSGTITGNATASGNYSGPSVATGATGGGRPTINVPNIRAQDYISLADYKLTVVSGAAVVQTKNASGVWTTCTTSACKGTGWTYSGGTWTSGSDPTSATYYVEGDVTIANTSGSTNRAVSVISTGSINVQGGSAELTPASTANNIQFVADGDVSIGGGVDLDSSSTVIEGQIMVRGQFEAGGNMEFQGRVMVQDVQGVGNLVANGANRIHGSVQFTYNGSLGAISTTTTITTTGAPTYVNNVSGWMEQ